MRVRFFSPLGFVVTAAVVSALYAAAHLFGLREDTAILSGTAPPGGAAGMALGLGYIALHFAWVIGAPILLLAAGLLWAMEKALDRRAARPRR